MNTNKFLTLISATLASAFCIAFSLASSSAQVTPPVEPVHHQDAKSDAANVARTHFADKDKDSIADADDLCLNTPPNAVVSATGCSGAQYVDMTCGGRNEWKSLGNYTKCIKDAGQIALDTGLLTNKEYAGMVRAAARKK